jgi:hypothetical protein
MEIRAPMRDYPNPIKINPYTPISTAPTQAMQPSLVVILIVTIAFLHYLRKNIKFYYYFIQRQHTSLH